MQLRGVTAKVGGRVLFSQLTMDIRLASMTVLVGPNGSGKSTALALLAGHLRASLGSISLAEGTSVLHVGHEVERRGDESVRSVLRSHHLQRADLGIVFSPDRIVRTLSGGERRRLEMAYAIESRADVVLFGEPTAELDSDGRDQLYGTIRRLLRRRTAVVVATTDAEFVVQHPHATLVILPTGEIRRPVQ